MEGVTVSELTQLRERADENPIEPDDAFIDFATDDFINKNIRVRPISGVTHGEGQQDRASTVSRGAAGTDGDDGLDWNQADEYEIKYQRTIVKKRAQQYQDELKRKQQIEERKAMKKWYYSFTYGLTAKHFTGANAKLRETLKLKWDYSQINQYFALIYY